MDYNNLTDPLPATTDAALRRPALLVNPPLHVSPAEPFPPLPLLDPPSPSENTGVPPPSLDTNLNSWFLDDSAIPRSRRGQLATTDSTQLNHFPEETENLTTTPPIVPSDWECCTCNRTMHVSLKSPHLASYAHRRNTGIRIQEAEREEHRRQEAIRTREEENRKAEKLRTDNGYQEEEQKPAQSAYQQPFMDVTPWECSVCERTLTFHLRSPHLASYAHRQNEERRKQEKQQKHEQRRLEEIREREKRRNEQIQRLKEVEEQKSEETQQREEVRKEEGRRKEEYQLLEEHSEEGEQWREDLRRQEMRNEKKQYQEELERQEIRWRRSEQAQKAGPAFPVTSTAQVALTDPVRSNPSHPVPGTQITNYATTEESHPGEANDKGKGEILGEMINNVTGGSRKRSINNIKKEQQALAKTIWVCEACERCMPLSSRDSHLAGKIHRAKLLRWEVEPREEKVRREEKDKRRMQGVLQVQDEQSRKEEEQRLTQEVLIMQEERRQEDERQIQKMLQMQGGDTKKEEEKREEEERLLQELLRMEEETQKEERRKEEMRKEEERRKEERLSQELLQMQEEEMKRDEERSKKEERLSRELLRMQKEGEEHNQQLEQKKHCKEKEIQPEEHQIAERKRISEVWQKLQEKHQQEHYGPEAKDHPKRIRSATQECTTHDSATPEDVLWQSLPLPQCADTSEDLSQNETTAISTGQPLANHTEEQAESVKADVAASSPPIEPTSREGGEEPVVEHAYRGGDLSQVPILHDSKLQAAVRKSYAQSGETTGEPEDSELRVKMLQYLLCEREPQQEHFDGGDGNVWRAGEMYQERVVEEQAVWAQDMVRQEWPWSLTIPRLLPASVLYVSELPPILYRVFDETSVSKYTWVGFISGSPYMPTEASYFKSMVSGHASWNSRTPTPFISVTTSPDAVRWHVVKKMANQNGSNIMVALIDTAVLLGVCGINIWKMHDAMDHFGIEPRGCQRRAYDNEYICGLQIPAKAIFACCQPEYFMDTSWLFLRNRYPTV